MSFSLETFDLPEMLRCGLDLRRVGRTAGTLEEAAGGMVRYLYDTLRDPETGARQCVLVRFYKTRRFGELEAPLRDFATRRLQGHQASDGMKCLVLLGTAGDRREWNAPELSRGHRAIPLPSAEIVSQAPMIAQLVHQLGLDLHSVVEPRDDVVGALEGKTYNVFYVPEAAGHPAIPAQREFVQPCGIRSVVGCGGITLTGDFFAAILFARVFVPRASAVRFRNVALDLKLAISEFREG